MESPPAPPPFAQWPPTPHLLRSINRVIRLLTHEPSSPWPSGSVSARAPRIDSDW